MDITKTYNAIKSGIERLHNIGLADKKQLEWQLSVIEDHFVRGCLRSIEYYAERISIEAWLYVSYNSKEFDSQAYYSFF